MSSGSLEGDLIDQSETEIFDEADRRDLELTSDQVQGLDLEVLLRANTPLSLLSRTMDAARYRKLALG
jgi:hypothetical protein